MIHIGRVHAGFTFISGLVFGVWYHPSVDVFMFPREVTIHLGPLALWVEVD